MAIHSQYSRKLRKSENIAGYLFCAPAMILYLLIGLYTVAMSIIMTFYQWNISLSQSRFVGLKNFTDVLFSKRLVSGLFYKAVSNNMFFAFFSIITIIPIALVLAVLINSRKKAQTVFRTTYLIPMAVSGTAIFYMWRGIFAPDGVLNAFFHLIGLDMLMVADGWLGNMDAAPYAVLLSIIWTGLPGAMILYYAGLAAVDEQLYESADIDGANRVHKLIHITWPQVKPITLVIMVMLINQSFAMFDNIFVMTNGGPADATQVIGTVIYQRAFEQPQNEFGIASAIGWLGFLLTITFSLLGSKILLNKGDS
ncbi:MAG: sugar ABC transporter permease [bacterium]|nr:sugar ABC transporter permease [bacterium]